MSASHLPDDLARWPREPFAILGVSRQADARSIKRAYVQLLRHFKPEQLPQHFQQLRDAYEKAAAHAQWREQYRVEMTGGEDELASTIQEEPDAAEPFDAEEIVAASRPPGPALSDDDVALAWREAGEGSTSHAYHRLLRWHARGGASAGNSERWKGYAQIYWLLTLHPSLSPDDSAGDWLVEGLRQSNAAWPLLELFRREIERDSHEAFRPGVDGLLESLAGPALASVLLLRWEARRERGEQELILRELERYRARFALDDSASWARLLIRAAELCVFAVPLDDSSLDWVLEELGSTQCAEQLGYRLDRLDHLLHVAEHWSELQSADLPRRWLTLFEEYFDDNESRRRKRLEQVLAEIARQPAHAVNHLDRMAQQYPAAANLLFEMLEQNFQERAKECQAQADLEVPDSLPPKLQSAIRQFWTYGWFRNEMILWSLMEFVSPAATAALIKNCTGLDITAAIAEDRSYHCVFSAWSAYWSV